MDVPPFSDPLIARLRDDVASGAAEVGRAAAEILRTAAEGASAGSSGELTRHLVDVSGRMLDAQPAMAPLVTLARRVLDAAAGAGSLDEARREAVAAAERFGDELDSLAGRVAERAAGLLPAGGTVATLSRSSTVRAALLSWARSGAVHVVCLEGRPMAEGRTLAAELAAHGLGVTLAVDAAAASLVTGCDAVLLGADSIGDLGAVNKIGSLALTLVARRRRVPVYVLADATKLLPAGWPQHLDDDRPRAEVSAAPPGVRVWNRYFEAVPLDLLAGVVTEAAVLSPGEVDARRAGIAVHEALLERAPGRARKAAGARTGPGAGNAPDQTG